MSANTLSDVNLDVGVTALVYNYLKSTHGVESLAEVYKQKFKPASLPQNSPSLEQVFDHFQENAPVKRRLLLTPTPAKKVIKNSNDANLLPKSEILKIPQKRKMTPDHASSHSVQFVEVMNSLVYDYMKTIPATVSLAEQYKMKFNPPALRPQNASTLLQVFDHFQETAPVKRRLSMNIITSTTPAKEAKKRNSTGDLIIADKSNIPTNAITIPQNKMKFEEVNLINSLVYNYLKTIPSTASLAKEYKTMFNPPALSKGFPTLEDVFGHFQGNAPINNTSNDSSITNNNPAPVESINTLIKALIREKTTVKKKREPSSTKTSNIPHGSLKLSTPNNASVTKANHHQQAAEPIQNIQDKVGERKPQMHKPDSYNYSNSTTTSRPLNSTSISTNVKKIAHPSPAFLAWTRWDNSVSSNNSKTCLQCGKIFLRTPSNLKIHFYTHMTPMEQKIVQSGWDQVCYFCSKRFRWFADLATHFVLHTRERPFKCDVIDCGRTFTQKQHLKIHACSHSSNLAERLPFECSVCGQRYTAKSQLKNHIKAVHVGIRHKCRWCEVTFSQKGSSRVHEKQFHPDEFKKESEKDE